MAATLYLVSAGVSADFIFNLPPAIGSGNVGIVKKVDADAHSVQVTPNGTDTIDGENAAIPIADQWAYVKLCDAQAGAWQLIP